MSYGVEVQNLGGIDLIDATSMQVQIKKTLLDYEPGAIGEYFQTTDISEAPFTSRNTNQALGIILGEDGSYLGCKERSEFLVFVNRPGMKSNDNLGGDTKEIALGMQYGEGFAKWKFAESHEDDSKTCVIEAEPYDAYDGLNNPDGISRVQMVDLGFDNNISTGANHPFAKIVPEDFINHTAGSITRASSFAAGPLRVKSAVYTDASRTKIELTWTRGVEAASAGDLWFEPDSGGGPNDEFKYHCAFITSAEHTFFTDSVGLTIKIGVRNDVQDEVGNFGLAVFSSENEFRFSSNRINFVGESVATSTEIKAITEKSLNPDSTETAVLVDAQWPALQLMPEDQDDILNYYVLMNGCVGKTNLTANSEKHQGVWALGLEVDPEAPQGWVYDDGTPIDTRSLFAGAGLAIYCPYIIFSPANSKTTFDGYDTLLGIFNQDTDNLSPNKSPYKVSFCMMAGTGRSNSRYYHNRTGMFALAPFEGFSTTSRGFMIGKFV